MRIPDRNQPADADKQWFVARVKHCQELAVRNMLLKLDIATFLPMRTVVRELRTRRLRVEVPAIRNLIFVHASKERACVAANDYGVPLWYIRDFETRSMLVVPDKQMEDFMRMMAAPDEVSIEECPLCAGQRVVDTEGELCGVEGELIRVANRSCVMIRIPQILSAAVRIPRRSLRILK